MKFDFMVSNPAFNIADTGNKAGTGGNTTLYRTATRHAFSLLKDSGMLLNITLKGIVPDLVDKHFSKYQTHFINLMDDIDVWPYNTCYFIVEKANKWQNTSIYGGLAAKIYSPYQNECFPFVYYSGADNGMKGFCSAGKNKVIRKLPGRFNDNFVYDYTDIDVDYGWKFAFNVMESKKSYSVTREPIRGGTICYIPTNSQLEAEKLKLFTENNLVYKEYINRSKIKYHAFGLRNIKKFDLSQIRTGFEIPIEWGISDADLAEPKILYNENVKDTVKVKNQGQVYTPRLLVSKMLSDLEDVKPDAFVDSKYTFCDSMCGNGKFLTAVLNKKMSNGIDKKTALKTIYGVDVDQDAVNDCKHRLLGNDQCFKDIVDANIICADTFTYDYYLIGA